MAFIAIAIAGLFYPQAKGLTELRVLIWSIAGVLALIIAGYLALQYAIKQNGPAVLDTVDRIAGGSQSVELIESTTFGNSPMQKIAVYRAADAPTKQRVLLFVHGGSWSSGDPDDYGFIGRNLASSGFTVVISGYRMAPGALYPAMIEDAAGAIGWAHRNITEHGGDPERIFLMGHSAGAYNVMMAALEPRWLEAEAVPDAAIAGVIGLAGPYDFYPFDSDSTRTSFGQAADPEATQPINFVHGDAPPLLLITGDVDTTVKPRNTHALADAIQSAGGVAETEVYQGMDHSAPLVALAQPWRDRGPVAARIEAFAARISNLQSSGPAPSSLAVQGKTR